MEQKKGKAGEQLKDKELFDCSSLLRTPSELSQPGPWFGSSGPTDVSDHQHAPRNVFISEEGKGPLDGRSVTNSTGEQLKDIEFSDFSPLPETPSELNQFSDLLAFGPVFGSSVPDLTRLNDRTFYGIWDSSSILGTPSELSPPEPLPVFSGFTDVSGHQRPWLYEPAPRNVSTFDAEKGLLDDQSVTYSALEQIKDSELFNFRSPSETASELSQTEPSSGLSEFTVVSGRQRRSNKHSLLRGLFPDYGVTEYGSHSFRNPGTLIPRGASARRFPVQSENEPRGDHSALEGMGPPATVEPDNSVCLEPSDSFRTIGDRQSSLSPITSAKTKILKGASSSPDFTVYTVSPPPPSCSFGSTPFYTHPQPLGRYGAMPQLGMDRSKKSLKKEHSSIISFTDSSDYLLDQPSPGTLTEAGMRNVSTFDAEKGPLDGRSVTNSTGEQLKDNKFLGLSSDVFKRPSELSQPEPLPGFSEFTDISGHQRRWPNKPSKKLSLKRLFTDDSVSEHGSPSFLNPSPPKRKRGTCSGEQLKDNEFSDFSSLPETPSELNQPEPLPGLSGFTDVSVHQIPWPHKPAPRNLFTIDAEKGPLDGRSVTYSAAEQIKDKEFSDLLAFYHPLPHSVPPLPLGRYGAMPQLGMDRSKKSLKKEHSSIISFTDSSDYLLDQPPPGTLTEAGMRNVSTFDAEKGPLDGRSVTNSTGEQLKDNKFLGLSSDVFKRPSELSQPEPLPGFSEFTDISGHQRRWPNKPSKKLSLKRLFTDDSVSEHGSPSFLNPSPPKRKRGTCSGEQLKDNEFSDFSSLPETPSELNQPEPLPGLSGFTDVSVHQIPWPHKPAPRNLFTIDAEKGPLDGRSVTYSAAEQIKDKEFSDLLAFYHPLPHSVPPLPLGRYGAMPQLGMDRSKKSLKKEHSSIISFTDSSDYLLDQPPPGTLTEAGMRNVSTFDAEKGPLDGRSVTNSTGEQLKDNKFLGLSSDVFKRPSELSQPEPLPGFSEFTDISGHQRRWPNKPSKKLSLKRLFTDGSVSEHGSPSFLNPSPPKRKRGTCSGEQLKDNEFSDFSSLPETPSELNQPEPLPGLSGFTDVSVHQIPWPHKPAPRNLFTIDAENSPLDGRSVTYSAAEQIKDKELSDLLGFRPLVFGSSGRDLTRLNNRTFYGDSSPDFPVHPFYPPQSFGFGYTHLFPHPLQYPFDQPLPGTLTEAGMTKKHSSAAGGTPGVNQDDTRDMELHAAAGPSTFQLSTSSPEEDVYDFNDELSGCACSESSASSDQASTVCSDGSRTQDVYELSEQSEPGGDGDAPPDMDVPVTAANCSVTNTLPAHSHLQIFSSDSRWSRRDSSGLPRSHSMLSLSQITSENIVTGAGSLPNMLLESSFEEFTPDITDDEHDETYRFQCSGPGLYQCSVTGLVFHMEGEGVLVYRTVPWSRRLLVQHHKRPAGPLFDIKCVQQSVCRLHLPHCEIRSTGGGDFLSVAHVTDEDVEFISPHEITETHVIINITGFSAFGNVKDEDSPADPVRALVLLFYKPPADPVLTSLLNVLLLPKNVVLQDVVRIRKKLVGDERYIETPSHCKLHPKQEYSLSTCPEDDSVLVQPTKAEFDCDNYDNYIVSFQVEWETIMKHIKLLLRDTNSSNIVWERRVCLSSTGGRRSDLNLPPPERLFDIRSSFVDSISGPVLKSLLDKLLKKKVIGDSERESADVIQINSDKARFVIDTVRKKGEAASSEMIEFLCEADPFLCKHLGLT